MKCDRCNEEPVYRCNACGEPVCGPHARLRTVCPLCLKKKKTKFRTARVSSEREKAKIRGLVKRFWGEEEQLSFDKKLNVTDLPAFVAQTDEGIVGFASFAETDDAIIVVALAILPQYQNTGMGKSLISKIETEARKLRKKRLLVSTSNDNLPALSFYQALGFQIYEAKPDVIAEKHGGLIPGIGGIPLRDELRLRKILY